MECGSDRRPSSSYLASIGPNAIRLGDWTTTVAVDKTAQALEITWEPKNDKKDDPSNTVLVLLGKEATVVVNGYVHGEPVK